jgi:hypothetical protein
MSEINLTIKLDTTGNVTVARGGRVLEWPVSEAPPSCDEIIRGPLQLRGCYPWMMTCISNSGVGASVSI